MKKDMIIIGVIFVVVGLIGILRSLLKMALKKAMAKYNSQNMSIRKVHFTQKAAETITEGLALLACFGEWRDKPYDEAYSAFNELHDLFPGAFIEVDQDKRREFFDRACKIMINCVDDEEKVDSDG